MVALGGAALATLFTSYCFTLPNTIIFILIATLTLQTGNLPIFHWLNFILHNRFLPD
jgi:hypothetical protein